MNLLRVVLVLAPLLAGGLCLALGWRRMRRHRLEAEADFRGGSFLLMLVGCLLVSAFFYPALVAASVPRIVAVSIEVVLCGLLILWGEATLRAALLAGQREEATPWVDLCRYRASGWAACGRGALGSLCRYRAFSDQPA